MDKIPGRVRIGGVWYNAVKGFNKIELQDHLRREIYTLIEPYAHMRDFYHVLNSDGRKVGEIHMDNKMFEGVVEAFE